MTRDEIISMAQQVTKEFDYLWCNNIPELERFAALVAAPKRQPLTDGEINEIADSMPGGLDGFLKGLGWQQFARAIEAAHGIGAEHDAR